MDPVVARRRVTERIGRGASVSLPIMVRPLASERLGQDDVLPDIAKVSEMRVCHAAHDFTSERCSHRHTRTRLHGRASLHSSPWWAHVCTPGHLRANRELTSNDVSVQTGALSRSNIACGNASQPTLSQTPPNRKRTYEPRPA